MLLQHGVNRIKEFLSYMRLFDTHCHYNDEKFKEDKDEIIEKIYEYGVKNAVVVGDNIESSKEAIEIANKYDFLYSAARNSPMRG